MNKILLSLILLASVAFSYQGRYSQEQVLKDFNAGDTLKYRNDYLNELTLKTLVDKGILTDTSLLVNESVNDAVVNAFLYGAGGYIDKYIKCPTVGENYTVSVWDYDLNSATIRCAVSEVNDLYNPFGYFTVSFPNMKKAFERDEVEAKEKMSTQIKQSIDRFNVLYKDKLDIKQSVTNYSGNQYLNIPDVLLSAILTDTDIIDVEATKTTNKLQLKEGYNSQITDTQTGEVSNNAEYIEAHAETIIDVYTKLSDLSMSYLLLLVVFFGIWGIGGAIARPLVDKIEGINSPDRKIPHLAGMVVGVLMFFPTADVTVKDANSIQQQYDVMHTRYQKFEKDGYYLFMNWAHDSTEAIIDSELDNLISRSGVSTKDTIISSYTGQKKYEKMQKFSEMFYAQCEKIYDAENIKVYTESKNTKFPTSENFLYARSLVVNNGPIYYFPTSNNGAVKSYPYGTKLINGEFYPEYMISACGKSYQKITIYQQKANDYNEKLQMSINMNEQTANNKIKVIRELIKFQYELFRELGPLSILGLPVTIMQTEHIGALIDKKSRVIDEIQKDIKKDSWGAHMIISSLPYLWIPGGGTTFQVVTENSGKLGALAGGAGGTASGGGAFSWFTGTVGGVVGGVTGTIAGGALGLYVAFLVGKTLLTLGPIIGIVLIGLVRFVIIYLKIFTFHFASVFLMPVMFARENIRTIIEFSLKIFATMLELPIFTLSIWLAITANQIIASLGDIFNKKIILGMLENNAIQYSEQQTRIGSAMENATNMSLGALSTLGNGEWLAKIKIYLYDGVMEVGIAIFAVIIIYKFIITLPNSIFELFELKGSQALDNSLDAIKNEGGNWGTKI